MTYEKFLYLTPPRAELAIEPVQLSSYERNGWLAQMKKNGNNSVIFVSPDKSLIAMNRHGEMHKKWKFSTESSEPFKRLPNKWYVFNAELLNDKTPHIKDVNFVHDVLVADGEYLIGKTYAERHALLCDLFKGQITGIDKDHLIVNNRTWIAKVFQKDFAQLFNDLSASEDEGLVLKKPDGVLRTSNNNAWLRKCRKPKKAFDF